MNFVANHPTFYKNCKFVLLTDEVFKLEIENKKLDNILIENGQIGFIYKKNNLSWFDYADENRKSYNL